MTVPATHTVVKTHPATRRFGSGIRPYIVPVVHAEGFTPPSSEDEAAYLEMLNAGAGPSLEDLAAEAEWQRQYENLAPPPGHCRSCGEPAELSRDGRCDRCEDLIDAASESKY